MKQELYQRIETNSIVLQELSDEFTEIVGFENFSKYSNMNFLYIEAYLLYFYNNQFEYIQKIQLFEEGESDKNISTIKSRLDETKGIELAKYFNEIVGSFELVDVKLSYLLKKISLTDNIITNSK
jgi:hypothetical protein